MEKEVKLYLNFSLFINSFAPINHCILSDAQTTHNGPADDDLALPALRPLFCDV
jgi:N12 class adenine-specific DNA methylase